MFRACKLFFPSPHLFVFLLFMLAVNKSYAEQSVPEAIDTMAVFHESEENVQILDEFSLETKEGLLKFQIYFLNQNEPYNNPISVKVFFQCEDQSFVRLDRKLKNGEAKTYCQYAEPSIVENEEFLENSGEHLVLPVYGFSDKKGECDLEEVSFEIYPILGLKRYCASAK